MHLLIDESVLARTLGGSPSVLLGQLEEMLRLVKRDRVRLRAIPLDFHGPLVNFGLFELFYLKPDEDPAHAVLYSEDHTDDKIVDDIALIRSHRAKFDQLWEMVPDETDTLALVRAKCQELATKISNSS